MRQRHRRPGERRLHRQLRSRRARERACAALEERDGAVRLVCTRDNILKIFRITGLDKVFPIFADVAEAQRLLDRPLAAAGTAASARRLRATQHGSVIEKGGVVFGISGD